VGGKCGTDLHETQFAINAIANAPSISGSLVHVEAGERYADSAEEFVDTQEVAVQGCEDDFRGVSLLRDQQLAFLVPFHVLGSLLLHRRLVLFLAECDRHEAIIGLCDTYIHNSACRFARINVAWARMSAGSEVGRLICVTGIEDHPVRKYVCSRS